MLVQRVHKKQKRDTMKKATLLVGAFAFVLALSVSAQEPVKKEATPVKKECCTEKKEECKDKKAECKDKKAANCTAEQKAEKKACCDAEKAKTTTPAKK